MSPSISDPQNRSVELPTHFDDYDVDGDPNHRDVLEGVMEMVNRLRARESVESAPPRAKAFENYDGDVIAYEDLVVKEKIGHGGFGDVHVAMWNGNKSGCISTPPVFHAVWGIRDGLTRDDFETSLILGNFKGYMLL